MSTKKILITAGGAIIIVMILTAIWGGVKKNGTLTTTSPTPIYVPITPIPPKVQYNTNAVDKMMNTVNNRPQLSDADQQAKTDMINSINNPDGETIYQSSEFRVLYIKDLDVLQVEIFSANISQAKTDAVNWIEGKGISQQGVCNIPVTFFLNYNVQNQLQGQGIQFSPIADICQ